MAGYAAIVLAGGAGRRLGGPAKPMLPVGGAPMLTRVLTAVEDALPRIVVGPPALAAHLSRGTMLTTEEPPGGGPVAATAAGLVAVSAASADRSGGSAGADPMPRFVALLAADLPFLTATAVDVLRAAAASSVDGSVYVDDRGRRQLLCGVWRVAALRERLAALGDPAGRSIRQLVSGLAVAELAWSGAGPPPWYDCDTDTDLNRAQEWA